MSEIKQTGFMVGSKKGKLFLMLFNKNYPKKTLVITEKWSTKGEGVKKTVYMDYLY